MSETKVPALPAISDANLADVVRAVKQILDVREGLIGDPLDANVTYRDLVNSGIASINLTAGAGVSRPIIPITTEPDGYDPLTDLTQPPPPTGFTVTGGFATIQLKWDVAPIRNLAYTEVWRGETNVLGNAVRIGTSPTAFYVDNLGTGATRYYWVRHVTAADVVGPYNSTNGTAGTTATDPTYVMDVLSDAYGTTSLAPFFQIDSPTTINGVSVPAGTYIKAAFIADATITSAKIKDLVADKISTGSLTAGIGISSGYISSGITPGLYPPGHASFGTGYFLGQYGGSQQFYIGEYATNLIWNGSTLSVKGTVQATNAVFRGLTIQDSSGNVMLTSGNINASYITGLTSGQVSGLGSLATANSVFVGSTVKFADGSTMNTGDFVNRLSQINTSNISTFIASGAIGNAYIGNAAIDEAKIANAAISSAKIQSAAITSAKIGDAQVNTLKLAGDSVTIHESLYLTAYGTPNSVMFTVSMAYAGTVTFVILTSNVNLLVPNNFYSNWYLKTDSGLIIDSDTGSGSTIAVRAQLRGVRSVNSGWTDFFLENDFGNYTANGDPGAQYRILILKRYR